MIVKQDPLSLAEAKELLGEGREEIEKFIKSFSKMKPEDAKKMRGEIESLGIIKMKSEHLVKIIDIMPEDAADLNKIFVDVSLSEDEAEKILNVVKQYR